MSRRVIELAEGLVDSADERLSPDGLELERHYIRVACRLAEAELILAALEQPAGVFDVGSERTRMSDANYSVLEAAHAFWTFAVRLRARSTGTHARRAREPLMAGLRTLASAIDSESEAVGPGLLGEAARTLVLVAPIVEAVSASEPTGSLDVALDASAQQLVAGGVLGLLRLAAQLQEGTVGA